jgi:AcrR family transcriptional regulator
LQYYFKTKEELVLATFSEMEKEITSYATGTVTDVHNARLKNKVTACLKQIV